MDEQATPATGPDSDRFQAAVLRAIPDLVLVHDSSTLTLTAINGSLSRLLGYGAGDPRMAEENCRDLTALLAGLLHPADQVFFTDELWARQCREEMAEYEWRLRHANGQWHVFKVLCWRGGEEHCVLLLREVTDQQRIERELRLIAKVFDNSLDGIIITNAEGRIVQVNRAFSSITGYTEAEALGRKPSFLRSGLHEGLLFERIRPRLVAGGHWQGELINRRADGSLFPAWVSISGVCDTAPELIGLITTFRDLTQTRSSEERIRLLAYYDTLTDLPNRALFQDRLDQELQRAMRSSSLVALLFLDLDGFKAINDSMGHGVGDQLLKEVAQRLLNCVRGSDTVARMGGDEFTILLSDLATPDKAESAAGSVAAKVRARLAEPFRLQGREVFVSTSIGIALYPRDGDVASSLLRHADTAMYQAKEQGKNTWRFYDPAMSIRSMERMDLQNAMHRAVRDEQFCLLFQPLVRLSDQRVVGAECLLRWGHPDRGTISPADFVPIAEESGLIVPLGHWVLEEACQQFARWRRRGLQLERIAVNLSARQFADADLMSVIVQSLERAGMSPHSLELELTESILMDDIDYALGLLRDLKAMGVRIAIDDFGTGYSSLSYLRQLPLDCLKIDRSFVEELADQSGNHGIARAIVALARSLGLEVLAEGVEEQREYLALRQLGCDLAQGYWFGTPANAERFVERCQEMARAALEDECPHETAVADGVPSMAQ